MKKYYLQPESACVSINANWAMCGKPGSDPSGSDPGVPGGGTVPHVGAPGRTHVF